MIFKYFHVEIERILRKYLDNHRGIQIKRRFLGMWTKQILSSDYNFLNKDLKMHINWSSFAYFQVQKLFFKYDT
jgi:hypothetical protein